MSNNIPDAEPTADDLSRASVPFVWEVPDGFITRYANHAIAQNSGSNFFLTFFEFIPPILIGSDEEKRAQALKIKEVRPTPVARLAVSVEFVEDLVEILQEQLRKYQARTEADLFGDEEAEDE